jgi:hypothetical protein
MVNATLKPTHRTNFSVIPSLFNFRIERISQPGIKVKKINPRICLSTGMSKIIDMDRISKNITIYMKIPCPLDVLANLVLPTIVINYSISPYPSPPLSQK